MPLSLLSKQLARIARTLKFAALLVTLVLVGCATPPPRAPSPKALAPAPPLPFQGATVYHVLPQSSQIRIRVYSRGLLAGVLGHEHLVTTSDIEGAIYVQPNIVQTGFDLRIPLKSLVVDQPEARRREGPQFQAPLGPRARAGTRQHMLGQYELDADRYPVMTLRSISAVGPDWRPRVTLRITLHGVSRDYTIPTTIVHSGERLVAIGRLVLKQSDFDITPYSAFGGGLKVKDALGVSFHFVAAPAESDPVSSSGRDATR